MGKCQTKLLKLFKSGKTRSVVNVGIAGVSVANPLAGLFLSAAKECAETADEVRIDSVIIGLSTELNQEMLINQLYGYIEKSEDNAFYVVNTLRKALLSDSLIVCTIMGRILARHVAEGTRYTQEDNIIFHALESATDDDIRQFRRVMDDYLTKNEIGNNVFHIPNEEFDDPLFLSSLNWCEYNRIFNGTSGIKLVVDNQNYIDSYSPTQAAIRLQEYADSVKQVFRINNDSV